MSEPRTWQLFEADTGRVLVARLEIANTFWRRFVGLQFRRSLAADSGLLLTRCNAIHTFCLRFPIDVTYLNAANEVIAVRQNVPPWRVLGPFRNAQTIVETPAGQVEFELGRMLRWQERA